jgi:DNA-directed RNA polymerase subunit F
LLQKAAAVNHPGLKAPLEAFAAANRTLKEAVAARTAARRALRLHEVRRSELIDDLQGLIDRTEVRILDLFPGNKALVRAVLGIKRSRRRDEEEAPAQEDGQPAAPA